MTTKTKPDKTTKPKRKRTFTPRPGVVHGHQIERRLNYTLAQVAEIADVSTDTVRTWVETGQLKAVRMPDGHVKRVDEDGNVRDPRSYFRVMYAELIRFFPWSDAVMIDRQQ